MCYPQNDVQGESPLLVADPGFPIGGRLPVGKVLTSDAYAIQQKYVRKQKNWFSLVVGRGGGSAGGASPWIRKCLYTCHVCGK